MGEAYDKDIVLWSREQARLLRAKDFSKLDIEHLADEIEDVGKSEERELMSRLAVLLAHLIKWEAQPELRGNVWRSTINHQRKRIGRALEKTPSLKPNLADAEWRQDAWDDAVAIASKETRLDMTFPDSCPWPMEEVLAADFWPDA